MNTPFSDYSKPAYFYRLFHEGRPFAAAQPFDEFDFPAFQKAVSHFMRTGEIIRKDGQPLSEEQREKAKALHAKELRMPHTSPVDPLDGVW